MIRTAIYARYSSEHQRDASIEDQVRLCRAHVEREGWQIAEVYTDRGISGSTALLRPGYQKLLEDARAKQFEVVVAEGLDRLSRDQEDVAALYKHLSFAGVKVVTLAEGDVNELHVGLKGTMNALYLKDLAQKTRRGLEGRVRRGRSGGGLCYGYDVVAGPDGDRGGRLVNETQAAIVRRIFQNYAAGQSPRAIAKALNGECVHAPRVGTWSASSIHGNWRRGTGILNNELYVGRLVWNRQRFVKDPTTGRRQARLNPPDAWIVEQVPDLRIVPQDLWDQVKARQKHGQTAVERTSAGYKLNKTHRQRYLFSGLLTCGVCGGGYTIVSRQRYGCANHRNRGSCDNTATIGRIELETRILEGLKSKLMAPELVEEFVREYALELNRLTRGREAESATRQQELAAVERKIGGLLSAIEQGVVTSSTKARLEALEARKVELSAIPQVEATPRIHPGIADIYRSKVENLQVALNDKSTRHEAGEILRCLIDEVRMTPTGSRLKIELFGELAAILGIASENKTPPGEIPRGAVSLVAGVGFEPTIYRL